jgi:hypothetical protein
MIAEILIRATVSGFRPSKQAKPDDLAPTAMTSLSSDLLGTWVNILDGIPKEDAVQCATRLVPTLTAAATSVRLRNFIIIVFLETMQRKQTLLMAFGTVLCFK